MFLDADDYYAENACECAYRAISETGVDIVHFGTKVLNRNHLPEKELV